MFTGERVIPGEVEPDLWNEHLSRYHFAALFAAGKSVLDAGCGTGYGTALLAGQAAEAVGLDISPEAIAYATAQYPNARFLIGSTDAFPSPDASVDLVTAFELIQHVPNWPDLIDEAHRVLRESGVLLVSTSHVHGFDLAAFEEALARVFPFVRILAQNHQECLLFAGEQTAQSGLSFIAAAPDLTQAHFFLAVCAKQPVEVPSFVFVPSAANLLRQRERDIESLNSELRETRLQHATLVEAHRRLEEELNRQNAWAISLDQEVDNSRTDIALTRAERNVARAEVERLKRERRLAASSRWLRLGRKFNIGPDLTNNHP